MTLWQSTESGPKHDLVAVYTSYFKDDFSEVELQPLIFEILKGVF